MNVRYILAEAFRLRPVKVSKFTLSEPKEFYPAKTSNLGKIVEDSLTFEPGTYTKRDGTQVSFEGLVIDAVLMEVSMEKNIVRTPVPGRNGTVKEYVSDGDFKINIYGALIHPSANEYPEEAMRRLIDLCQVSAAVPVLSNYLDQFGIYNIVINTYSFKQKQGYANLQMFQIGAYSDAPFTIIQHVDD